MAMQFAYQIKGVDDVALTIAAVDQVFGRKGTETDDAMMKRFFDNAVEQVIFQYERKNASGAVAPKPGLLENTP